MIASLSKNLVNIFEDYSIAKINIGYGTPKVTKENDVVSQLEMQFKIQKKCQKAYEMRFLVD